MLSFWSNSGQSKAQPAQPTAAPSTSVDKNGAVTHHLPGVFVPNCQDGTVIFPTTRRKPSGKKRTVIPPPPTSITNCTLLSDGGVGHVAWAPPAAPPIRRPSRCMSVDANGNAIPPEYVPKAIGETLDVENLANNPAKGKKDPGLRPQEASKSLSSMGPGQTPQPISTSKQPRSKSAAPKAPSSTTNGGGSISSSKRPGLMARGKSHISMHDIVRKVRNHLSSNSRRQTGSSEASPQPAPTAQKTPADDIETASVCHRGSCQYVLNDGEVQDVVEIVVHEMCKHGVGPVDKDQGVVLQPGDEVPRQVVRKPSCLMNAFGPQVSDLVEPATTISLPETAFFARSQSDGQIRARVRSSKVSMTTILSKDNVTDIRWAADDTKPENEPQGDAKDGPTGKPDGESSAEAGSAAKAKAQGDQEQPNDNKAAAQKMENTKNDAAGDVPGTAETPAAGPRLHEISDCDMDDLSDYAIDNQPTTNPPLAENSTTKDVNTKGSYAINQELDNGGTEAKTPEAVESKLDSKEALPGADQADEFPMKQSGLDDAERGGLKQASNPDDSITKEVDPSPHEVDSSSAGPDLNKLDAKEDGTKVPDADQEDPQQVEVLTSDDKPAESKTLKSRFLETFLKPSNDTAADGASGHSEIPREASLQKENSKSSIDHGLDDQQDVTSFHPLSKRHGTHEWHSPPYGAIPEEQETDDLYHLGVDARPGGAVPATDSNNSRPDPTTTYNFGLFNRSVFGEGTYDATLKPGRRVSEASIMAVGAAAPRSTDKVLYRSRSAHFADVSNSDPGFLQKLTRKLSSVFQTPPQTPVMRAPAPSIESTAISRKASESHVPGDPSEGGEADTAGYISEPEPSSVYQAMTVSKPAKAEAQRRSICSEDNAPQRIDAVTSLKGLIGPGGR
ncbi:hypothetical protein CGCF415_v015524 [Colletotrichum fructicola]|uniref:Uncharacterized protein n=1 Tax=Colletotrichum fructicola (strain Nara gc5) TaxID=1213859 RepID=L2FI04_COLFN|nr:hypothetical protein CFRS1_v015861 [Colletotrichum fructicola]KAF4881459.1 hypothetical protein CGCFRS4_v015540 [Colletotrichum fructicola]KAF4884893.1 hypothetical protein CGCF415_v015524 [Colletotrichum fructicola]